MVSPAPLDLYGTLNTDKFISPSISNQPIDVQFTRLVTSLLWEDVNWHFLGRLNIMQISKQVLEKCNFFLMKNSKKKL